MAFRLESTYDGAGTIVETVNLTDSEAASVGEAMVFAAGKVTKCATTAAPQAIAIEAVTAGTNNDVDVILVRRDQVFLADYIGIAPVVGTKSYVMDPTGLLVNGSTTGGKVEIVSVDTANTKCRVKFDL